MFSLSGRASEAFASWSETFCGKERAIADIVDYLQDEWGIKTHDLGEFVDTTPDSLRWEVERIWREAHEARRQSGFTDYDEYIIDRLVKHDVECFLGVLGKMTFEGGELGYVHWWMTFDKTVRDFERKLKETIGSTAPQTPVMSPDFLADYLAVGPVRAQVSKAAEASLPVALFDMLPDHVPAELLEIAEAVRKE